MKRAIRDYNSQMSSALRLGEQKGMERGIRQGERERNADVIIEKISLRKEDQWKRLRNCSG